MEKINLPPFYVGQKVVYITGKNLPLNSEWIIKGVFKLNCGCWVVDIGKKNNKVYDEISCRIHSINTTKKTNIDVFKSTSFVPIEQTFIAISYEKVIEIEQPLISAN